MIKYTRNRPPLTTQQLRQDSQHHPVRRRHSAAGHRRAQHRQVAAQDRDLNPVGVRRRTSDQGQYPPDDHQRHRADHHDT
jgi:hypothetical protein